MRYLLIPLLLPAALAAQEPDPHVTQRALLKELVEINTSDSAGRVSDAARAMQRRLLAAGFPEADVQVIGPSPKYLCLVARLRGRNPAAKPLLMVAHLDVVDARKEDWTTDPFKLVEKDGWLYGRGTVDDKQGDAILVANFIRYKREGFVPSRDLIDRVASYIDKRRLITARVNVGKPKLVPVSLELTISLKPGATADRVKADVKDKVKKLLNPLHGGPKADGWPFGRAVGKADLYPIVEGVEGVDRITDLVIVDEGRRLRVEMLKMTDDELPNLIGVEIYDRG